MKIVWVSTNKHYQVIVSPRLIVGDAEGDISNYYIQNIQTELMEASSNQLPQAIAVAEQFDFMLENDTWKDALSEMFPGYIDEGIEQDDLLINLDEDTKLN